jgi:predicted neutral ceramidase superfamily lipid hydrolase
MWRLILVLLPLALIEAFILLPLVLILQLALEEGIVIDVVVGVLRRRLVVGVGLARLCVSSDG